MKTKSLASEEGVSQGAPFLFIERPFETEGREEMANPEAGNQGYIRVGKVKDAHGIKGELFIVLFAGEAAWLGELKEIRLASEDGDTKVFPVKSVRLHKNGLIAKSADIRTRNEAEALIGRLFEIPAELLVSKPGETVFLREVHGFKVVTKQKGEVGTVTGFSSNGAQDLLVIETNWGEFEVPFVEAYVEEIDYEGRVMRLDLPEGLLGELEGDEIQ